MLTITGMDIRYKELKDTNIHIAYIDEGSADEVLLFVHGLGNSFIGWEHNIQHLYKEFRCIAIDLPGNGFSSKDDYPYGIPFFADTIAAFIKEMDLKRVSLVGHSMGGQVSIYLSHQYPDLVHKLILVAPAGLEKFSSMERNIMTAGMKLFDFAVNDRHKLEQTLAASFYRMGSDARRLIERMVQMLDMQPGVHYKSMVDACVTSMLELTVLDIIPGISIPALILFGSMDALIPNKIFHPVSTQSIAEKGASLFPDAQLRMIPLGGHFVHWEQELLVNEAISDFMKDG